MSFHLEISMRQDPASSSGLIDEDRQAVRSRVATFEISGELSEPDRQRLQNQLESLASSEAETIVIDLVEVSSSDQSEATRFCEWISRLRGEGKPLHVVARQVEIYELLEEVGHQPDWLMPFSGVETKTGRQVISVDGINPNVKRP